MKKFTFAFANCSPVVLCGVRDYEVGVGDVAVVSGPVVQVDPQVGVTCTEESSASAVLLLAHPHTREVQEYAVSVRKKVSSSGARFMQTLM